MKYVAIYDTPANKEQNRGYQLSAANKIDYICGVLSRLGHPVEIVSASLTANKKGCARKNMQLSEMVTLKLFPCLGMGGVLKRAVRKVLTQLRLLAQLLFHTRKGEPVLVYHSVSYANTIALARRIKDFRLILEVEEIYADVTGNEKDRPKEFRLFAAADAYLFPTQLLAEIVNTCKKPCVIVHGTYQAEPDRGDSLFQDDKIHCVYAGTLDPRKGAAMAAAAAEFLPEHYHIHILGFGSEAEKRALQELAEELSGKCRCGISYDGLRSGDDYIRFLQSCHIGLSPQDPDAAFNGTSFPSKVLSYMANGLQVVSIRIPTIERSAISNCLHFYDEQTPEEIAKAILSVDPSCGEDPRMTVEQLDKNVVRELEKLLNAV